MLKLITFLLIGIATGLAAYFLNIQYSYADFKDYGYTLLTTSGMVFTIMGIWIAFIYPNALMKLKAPQKIQTADFSKSLQDTRRLEKIVGSIMASAGVAVGVSTIYFLKLVLYGLPYALEYRHLLKSGAMGFITFLSLVQVMAIFYVMYSNYLFIEDLHVKREDREADADF
ncbi:MULTISPECIES: hypothetical protein [Pseudomonas syringae group]|uniref:Uncharacterized protein n=1 Tax=Pseudomonas syringae pv. actinidiae TaxID=103796 RepID=A0A7Z6U9Z9_PSESF|nr:MULTISPECIES: hypothetical protein [Pseudomonas syringae group]MDU8455903.1 hypothetical protein [Pseudomonas syringae group sp. J254-4]QXW44230.1 hypothetical protein KXJ79_21550 [Pseudomonas amygdali]RMP82811.1 hypothetical protein ALQ15_01952 [Pseudomonas syringae pv. actinidiae]